MFDLNNWILRFSTVPFTHPLVDAREEYMAECIADEEAEDLLDSEYERDWFSASEKFLDESTDLHSVVFIYSFICYDFN